MSIGSILASLLFKIIITLYTPNFMDLRKEEFPATIQAFELQNNQEVFLAEKIVSSQAEADQFTALYAGKLIKASRVEKREVNSFKSTPEVKKERSSAGLIMFIIVLILAALVVYGFSTGWIQQRFNLDI